jgi:hypothetical protein
MALFVFFGADLDDLYLKVCTSLAEDMERGFHDFGADSVSVGNRDGGSSHVILQK